MRRVDLLTPDEHYAEWERRFEDGQEIWSVSVSNPFSGSDMEFFCSSSVEVVLLRSRFPHHRVSVLALPTDEDGIEYVLPQTLKTLSEAGVNVFLDGRPA